MEASLRSMGSTEWPMDFKTKDPRQEMLDKERLAYRRAYLDRQKRAFEAAKKARKQVSREGGDSQ